MELETHTNHPEYQRLLRLGVLDIAQRQRIFTVYLDLVESKGWYNVHLCPLNDTAKEALVLVGGHPAVTEEMCFVWPVSSDITLSMSDIQTMMCNVKSAHDSSSFVLGIVDADSSVVYYSLTNGLVPPESPDDESCAKAKQRRKTRRQRLRKAAHEAALLPS